MFAEKIVKAIILLWGEFMVSVKDIAARCKVSVATVSKALNGYKDISEKKRTYIKAVAKEMGYFPNSAAVALKTNRTYNIGVLFVDGMHNGLTHEHFARVLQGFRSKAEEKGYDITFINNYIGGRTMTYTEYCYYRGVDGVVIACIDYKKPEVVDLVNSGIPIVTIDHIFQNATSVISDNIRGVYDLVHYAYDMGHRKIAFIHGEDSAVSLDRLNSFYQTMQELEMEVPKEYVRECVYRDTKMSGEQTAALLDLEQPPTCILYPDDFTALGGINLIKRRELKIPEDISIMGYDGISYSKILEPPLTTLAQDADEIGRSAAAHLIQIIETPKSAGVERIIIKGSILEGGSVKRLTIE